jgi:hypothetical protein
MSEVVSALGNVKNLWGIVRGKRHEKPFTGNKSRQKSLLLFRSGVLVKVKTI